MDRRPLALVLALSLATALVAGACEEEEDAGAGAVQSADVVTNITLTQTDNKPFALAAGSYRVEWASSCPSISITFTGDTGYTKEKTSKIATFSTILTVPAGTYQVGQTDAACTEWAISVSKI